jgi:hypothetical protein
MENRLVGLVLSAMVFGLLSTATVSLAEDDSPVEELEEAFSEQLEAVENSFKETIKELEGRFFDIIEELEEIDEEKKLLVEKAEEIIETLGELEKSSDEFREDLEEEEEDEDDDDDDDEEDDDDEKEDE